MWCILIIVYKNILLTIYKDHMHIRRKNRQSNASVFVSEQRYLVIYLVVYKFGNASSHDQERIKKHFFNRGKGSTYFR